ncbi:MAG: VOC family protein [Ferruginibacter sp.]
MKLNHINLIVSNVAEAVEFFKSYFNFTCTEIKGDNIIAVLSGTDGFTLVLMKSKEAPIHYPVNFHIGFLLDSEANVIATHSKLKAGGINLTSEPKKIRDSFGFYFSFDEVMIEVGCYL